MPRDHAILNRCDRAVEAGGQVTKHRIGTVGGDDVAIPRFLVPRNDDDPDNAAGKMLKFRGDLGMTRLTARRP